VTALSCKRSRRDADDMLSRSIGDAGCWTLLPNPAAKRRVIGGIFGTERRRHIGLAPRRVGWLRVLTILWLRFATSWPLGRCGVSRDPVSGVLRRPAAAWLFFFSYVLLFCEGGRNHSFFLVLAG